MPNIIDPSEIAGPADAPTVPGPQDTSSQSQGQIIDPKDIGDVLPEHSNGLSPTTPINSSPLSIADRVKMSLGNEVGNYNYLKNHGDISSIQKDNTGHFLVQSSKDNLWYRVDPKVGGDGDAWSRTKEIIGSAGRLFTGNMGDQEASDLAGSAAQILPTAAKIAGSVAGGMVGSAAGPAGSAVGSAAAAAGMEGWRTSLGRLVGTYQASDADQMKDLGMEALFNLAGSAIAAGVKPAVGLLGRAAKGIGESLSEMSPSAADAAKSTIAKTLGFISGTGEKAINTLLDNGDEVTDAVREAVSGRSQAQAIDYLKNEQVDTLKDMAKEAQPALNRLYSGLKDKLIDAAGDDFKANMDDVLKSTWADAIKGNIGVVVKDGKPLNITADEIMKDGLPNGASFALKTLNGLQADQRIMKTVNPIANDPESYKLVENLYQSLKNFSGWGEQSGEEGLNNLLEMKKTIGDLAYKLGTAANDQGLDIAKRFIAQVESNAENQMLQSMNPETQALYKQLMGDYHAARSEMTPLINALSNAREKGDAVFEPLLNKIQARAGSNSVVKDQFSNALDIMEENGSKRISQLVNQMDINDAASKFIPTFRKNMGGVIGAGGLGSMAAVTGHPVAALAVGGAGLAASPRAMMMGINGAQALGDLGGQDLGLAVKSMWNLKDMIGNLDDENRSKLIQSPNLLNGLVQSVVRTPMAAKAIHGALVNYGMQQAQPQQMPQDQQAQQASNGGQ